MEHKANTKTKKNIISIQTYSIYSGDFTTLRLKTWQKSVILVFLFDLNLSRWPSVFFDQNLIGWKISIVSFSWIFRICQILN